ncbi:unnamed protein product [Brachionus calyciflorus]|uniref:Sphingomyelin phosphodiesterase n=1 Tax=Brachionus calyciflorus TaxID=104777 RepID=A0A813TZQ9_9BILA|nr:unnamed protein product [Brachionus calyciflorus]
MLKLSFLLLLSLTSFIEGTIFDLIAKDKRICTNEVECLLKNNTKSNYCDMCKFILPTIRFMIRQNQSEQSEIQKIVFNLCINSKESNKQMCSEYIDTYWNSWKEISLKSPLNDSELCDSFIGCQKVDHPIFKMNLNLPNKLNKKRNRFINKILNSSKSSIRILQLTDIHIDYEYTPFSLADCDQPLCCRNTSTSTRYNISNGIKEKLAGYWGSYKPCGLPPWTIENLFDHLENNEKFDFIFWTGDIVPHSFWINSQITTQQTLNKLINLFRKFFPNKKIYSVIGNHDSNPQNQFSNGDLNNWLYKQLSEEWTQIGVPKSQIENIKKGAYYTSLLYPGLRLISINNNLCYPWNFQIYINTDSLKDQFKWLIETLQKSEDNEEKVFIIGHVNPQGCIEPFSDIYYKIINRYNNLIKGQFFGHKHFDSFEMFYDLKDLKKPTSIAYITGSVSTYSNQNPSYRIFTIDQEESFKILDYDTYYMNLSDANRDDGNNYPKWIKEYSAKEDLNLNDLTPLDYQDLIMRLENDEKLFEKFFKFYYKSNDQRPRCDSKCKKSFICKLKQAKADNHIPCY